jgi:uncharacterized membrane protein YphA (DoxX/SURF4 family)
MAGESAIGRVLFAFAVAAIGALSLTYARFVPSLEPVATAFGQPAPWTWLSAAVLLVGASSLLADRTARVGAVALAALFFLWVALLHGPGLIASVKNQADDALHTLAFAAAALVLAAGVRRPTGGEPRWDRLVARAGVAGRYVFGLCLVGFGVMHFVFFQFTADFIPAWIPWHRFWAAATGVAQIAAGLAVLSGMLARLAADLSALMYGSWAFIVHAPRVFARPTSQSEWTDVFTVAGLCAGSLIIAGAVARRRPAKEEGPTAPAAGAA